MITQMSENPIGVFDSGVGGLTVVREIRKVMPCEDIIYLGDTARLPYGSKSENTILKFCLENTIFLNTKKVKIIVIACNTASAISLEYLRNFIKIPLLGVIECAALGAVRATKNKKVGVIGTSATIKSGAYTRALQNIEPGIEVLEYPTPLLANLVEESWTEKEILKSILIEYLSPLMDGGIDTLILGCTHYPLLAHRIRELFPDIAIIDSSKETSHFLLNTLLTRNLLKQSRGSAAIQVFFTDPHPNSMQWANDLLGEDIHFAPVEGIFSPG